jgi:hypothetical protein
MASRLLIAAGESAASADRVPATVRSLIEGAEEVMLIAPSLPTRWEWMSSATDKATAQADERLSAVLGQLDEICARATGRVGADDPLTALEDAIRDFGPDHLLIGLRPEDQAGWQERGLIDRVQERFGIPTTVSRFRWTTKRAPGVLA